MERGRINMDMVTSAKNLKIIDFNEASKPSQLEKKYAELYSQEFVNDLKNAYHWMKKDMRKQPSSDKIIGRRKRVRHEIGDWISVFYVDFRNENFYSQTIDDIGGKTIYNYGHSPLLKADNDNIRYLLSGLYLYDKNKAKKWLINLLGKGEKFWYEKV